MERANIIIMGTHRHFIPCPGKVGANLLAPCQISTFLKRNTRDHDFGKVYKNGKHSYFPYMFLEQLV